MPASILIYGPAGCGKTHHKEALAKHYGLMAIDDHVPSPGREYAPNGFLYLSEHMPTFSCPIRVVRFADAMAEAGLEPKPPRPAAPSPHEGRFEWRIVNTDNFGSDYPNERFVENIPYLPKAWAQEVADALNKNFGPNVSRFFKVEHKDYKLQPGFEP